VEKTRLGFCITGSFCTFERIIPEIEKLVKNGYDVTPILSETAYNTDTRFGKASDFTAIVKEICKNEIIKTITEAEPIGPKKLFDAMIIAPCTGNTIAKLACGITDTAVTMAAKAHLRNQRPLVLAVSTNDGLGLNGKNIGILSGIKGVYFVPYGQDDPHNKVNSLVADMTQIEDTLKAALEGKQIQPVLK
jgi:dipicolinate synthase subunit B